MAKLEHLQSLAKAVNEKFGLQIDVIHEGILNLKVPGTGPDVARLILLPNQDRVAISFQIEVVPTDAIQVFEFARATFQEITRVQNPENPEQSTFEELAMLNCYFEGQDKSVYTGLDAQIMVEQERTNRVIKALEQREDKKAEQAEWELKRAQQSGKKVTWH